MKLKNILLSMFACLVIISILSFNCFASSNNFSDAFIESQKILLDTDFEVLDTVTSNGNEYALVYYSNILPYASGYEIISIDGKINNTNTANEVITQVSWKEAAKEIQPSDIETLKTILTISTDITAKVTPVASSTSYVIEKCDWLKSMKVNIPFMGEISAWDMLLQSYPGLYPLESELRNLDAELNEWVSISTNINNNLPGVVEGMNNLNNGEEMDSSLQQNVQQSISNFRDLKSKTDGISRTLTSVISDLSEAEDAIDSASDTPYVGSFISTFGDSISNLNSDLKQLKTETDEFSTSLGAQGSKLQSVSASAKSRNVELTNLWDDRQAALTKVYATISIVGIIVLLLIIFIGRIGKNKSNEVQQKSLKRSAPNIKVSAEELRKENDRTKTFNKQS